MYTAFYDPRRCFEETLSGAFSVTVASSWFPRHVLGRLHALCAYVRCLLVALYIAWRSWRCAKCCRQGSIMLASWVNEPAQAYLPRQSCVPSAAPGCRSGQQYDVVFVDQVSAVIPLLKRCTSARILFYCHFPDMLLAQRQSALRRCGGALEQLGQRRARLLSVGERGARQAGIAGSDVEAV